MKKQISTLLKNRAENNSLSACSNKCIFEFSFWVLQGFAVSRVIGGYETSVINDQKYKISISALWKQRIILREYLFQLVIHCIMISSNFMFFKSRVSYYTLIQKGQFKISSMCYYSLYKHVCIPVQKNMPLSQIIYLAFLRTYYSKCGIKF